MHRFLRKPNSGQLRPALFLHIQKTAGTSIVELATKYYGQANVCSHGDFLGKQPSDFASVPFISGHFGYDFARSLMPSRYCFTFLRDPSERILSYYYFCKQRDPNEFWIYKLAQERDLEAFLELASENPMGKACIWNQLTWQLAHGYEKQDKRSIVHFKSEELVALATEHLREFDHIGFTETFETDKRHVLKGIGIPNRDVTIKANVTQNKAVLKDLPSSTKQLLDQLTELDRHVYEYAWSHLHGKKRSFIRRISGNG